MIENWYDSHVNLFKVNFPAPNEYKSVKDFNDINIDKKYTNYKKILSDVKTFSNKLTNVDFSSIKNEPDDSDIIRCFKYEIKFSKDQQNKLNNYYNECEKVYNLCVDIWNSNKQHYRFISNWIFLKDTIYKYLYRSNLTDMNIIKQEINKHIKKHAERVNYLFSELRKVTNFFRESSKIQYNITLKYHLDEVKNNGQKLGKLEIKKVREMIKETIKERFENQLGEQLKSIKQRYMDLIKGPSQKRSNTSIRKPAPDETLKGEIKTFCANLKSALEQHNKDKFELTYKNNTNKRVLYLSTRSFCAKGIYTHQLKDLECKNYQKIYKIIKSDCKLYHDVKLNKFYLYIPTKGDFEIIKNKRDDIVALDPGEKVFQSYYSRTETGKLGDNMRIKILDYRKKIDKYKSIIAGKKNKKNKTINKKKISKKIRILNNNIKGYVNEIHKKSAKYLCENYDKILIPTFGTQGMLKNYNENNKKNNLPKSVKYVLQRQSHYKFKMYLKAMAKRYRVEVMDVEEAYTSKVCTYCGTMGDEYTKDRIKICKCTNKVDRDINGSRNILLKYMKNIIKK